jgi:hypothetical protein
MQTQLSNLCGEFEQVMLAQLLPKSLFSGDARPSDDEQPYGAGAAPELFAQAFAAAFERAGGMGLQAEFLRALEVAGDRRPG